MGNMETRFWFFSLLSGIAPLPHTSFKAAGHEKIININYLILYKSIARKKTFNREKRASNFCALTQKMVTQLSDVSNKIAAGNNLVKMRQ